jgi:HK97 family phage major capsid protein
VTLAGDAVPTDRSREAPHRGIVPALQRPLTFLDLMVTDFMEGNSVPYMQEQGDPAGAAAVVPEGTVKPASTITYADAEAKAATIAHYTKVRRQTLADVAQLDITLRARLMYGVLRTLEAQVIAGDGTGDNLRGILNTTGVGAPDVTAIELAADKTLEALVAVLVSGAQPNVIALHPRDWADMLRAKAEGSGEYLSAGPFVATAEQLWGSTAVPALGVPHGTALAGDTRLGATLLVREGVNVLISDSDQDDFVRNMVTLLAEGRWALAVWQPAAWAKVTL